MEDKIEEAIIRLRAIASILEFMSYAEDDVKDKDYALEFLSQQLFSCVSVITEELNRKGMESSSL